MAEFSTRWFYASNFPLSLFYHDRDPSGSTTGARWVDFHFCCFLSKPLSNTDFQNSKVWRWFSLPHHLAKYKDLWRKGKVIPPPPITSHLYTIGEKRWRTFPAVKIIELYPFLPNCIHTMETQYVIDICLVIRYLFPPKSVFTLIHMIS